MGDGGQRKATPLTEVRRITCNDIADIKKIADQTFPKPWKEMDFAYFLAHEHGWCRGAFEKDRLCAYLLSLVVQGEMDLVSIATDPKRQRKGYAAQLVEAAEKEGSVHRLLLEVNANNKAAIEFYKSQGFTQYGKRLKYYEGKEDALLMEKATKSGTQKA